MCRQSRLRGRIHARPSAGGLAALCPASSYSTPLSSPLCSPLLCFLSLSLSVSSSLLHTALLLPRVPSEPLQRSRLGPGPLWAHLGSLSPPTRSSRTVPARQHYLQFARYRAHKCERIERASCLASIFRVDSRAPARTARSTVCRLREKPYGEIFH